jgi:hypothetical protein
MSEDPRIRRAIGLLHRSWELLRDLQDLKRDFQEPVGGQHRLAGTPAGKRVEAYSRLVQRLGTSLSVALRTAAVDLNVRGDWDILQEVLPSAKDLTDEQWLKWLDDQLGPEGPAA